MLGDWVFLGLRGWWGGLGGAVCGFGPVRFWGAVCVAEGCKQYPPFIGVAALDCAGFGPWIAFPGRFRCLWGFGVLGPLARRPLLICRGVQRNLFINCPCNVAYHI